MSDFLWMTKSKQNKYTFPLDVFLVSGDHHRLSSATTPIKEFDSVDFSLTTPTSALKQQSFSAVDFVNEYRSRVDSLDTLLEELQEFKDYLKEETISIIHKEYSSFIEFSSKLNTITVDQVTTSMPSLIQQMKEFESFIHNLMSKCEKELLVKRRATQKEYISKKLLEIYQLVKFNIFLKLNSEKEKVDSNSTDFGSEDCIFSSIADHLKFCTNTLKQIEGTLLELSEENISTHTNMEKQHMVVLFEFYEKVDALLKDAENLYLGQLSSSFLYFLKLNGQTGKQEELYHVGLLKILDCMESLYLFGNVGLIEDRLAISIVNPLLDSIFTKECITQCKNNPEINVKTLLYDTINTKLALVMDPILEINNIGEGSSPFTTTIMADYMISQDDNHLHTFIKRYNFINNSVLQPVISKLHSDQCKFLFEYRNTKTFHTMFLTQKQFTDDFCKRFVSRHEMDLFTYTLHTVIKTKWQTKIYFALVKQQAVKEFEAALSQQVQSNQQEVSLENACDLRLKGVMDKMIDLVKNSLFNPSSTFLPELTQDFLTLYIQTTSRFQKWLLEQYIPQLLTVCKNLSQDGSATPGYLCSLISKLVDLETTITNIDGSIFLTKQEEVLRLVKHSYQSRITLLDHKKEASPVFLILIDKIKSLLRDKLQKDPTISG
ncbi:predicted protein [Naegleria gruberi]|uniref:Conserved oligomeric Golgi complex subunit 2 n=1 Tax=Naegleria gruberi TaxID=5762 RepID=D2V7C9_NAEGR|nr:uncharacterized protein NAEGRDRAFT_64751 [Naegleria gruberi]EFC47353.1 predicted protein [Naegleria gruberi]|eukprot:XP_002680097.1 predicted protein [Naegleria gruberi strain NEG-M]